MGPISGKRARMAEETLPCSRGRTLKVSMALATLGLVIFLSASISCVVSGTVSSCGIDGWIGSDSAFSPLGQQLLDLGDDLLDAAHVGVDAERPPEVGERALRLVHPEVDLPVAGERPEVGRVPLHDLVAVVEGLLVLPQQEVDGGAPVPALPDVRLAVDDPGEGLHRARAVAAIHLLDAGLHQPVDLLVAGAGPHLPDRV